MSLLDLQALLEERALLGLNGRKEVVSQIAKVDSEVGGSSLHPT